LHAAWTNSAGLQLARIYATTPDPDGGRLGRDEQGKPNGILFENAMDLMSDVIPESTVVQVSQAIETAQHLVADGNNECA
jgi:predicted amidohydrolase YtcJ